ncbi:M20 metallopeptidase family protein [Desmospora activa]|uniref:Amidohydrolase n=1 Tax=Desmospora activa DSM 45169 TaxID=1121389 RepID=A0A2T4ZDG4_9BACL|nr:amidohydrolase [Desmospora activa]PTM59906.1 amidohydrolase [Desmospora activa DSM 45169]
MQQGWRERIEAIFPQMVRWRRDFHQYPELSFQEERTAKIVADWLKQCGLQVRTGVGGNGVVAVLEGGSTGPTIALRADMDALPIYDEKSCAYRSQVPGVMHACGHDAHTATLMGVASLLAEKRKEIAGRVVFIFQHAEEQIPGGAAAMIADGALDGVDAIYGVHLWTPLPRGVVGLREGPLMAAADSFKLEVVGKGGHGGLPHEAVDAVAIASHVVVNLQTIIGRQVDPLKSGVISVGRIEGGRAFNVIAERCELEGTVRSFDPQLRNRLYERIEEVATQTCRMFGADCRLEYGWGYPAVVNDPMETQRLAQVARMVLGDEQVWEVPEIMAAEDFAYYLQKKPGAFCLVGAGNQEKGFSHPHHHPLFDLDEEAMKASAEVLIESALAYLHANRNPLLSKS